MFLSVFTSTATSSDAGGPTSIGTVLVREGAVAVVQEDAQNMGVTLPEYDVGMPVAIHIDSRHHVRIRRRGQRLARGNGEASFAVATPHFYATGRGIRHLPRCRRHQIEMSVSIKSPEDKRKGRLTSLQFSQRIQERIDRVYLPEKSRRNSSGHWLT
jgi:hypothetical protein